MCEVLDGSLYHVNEGVARIAGAHSDDSEGIYIFASDATEALDVAAEIDQRQEVEA